MVDLFNRLIHKLTSAGKTAKQLESFFANLQPSESQNKRVLQYVGIGSMYLTPAEILMYHLYRQHGFEVDYLIYGPSVPINEVITREREQNPGKDKFWKKSYANGERLLRAANVEFETIPISPEALSIAEELSNLDAVLAFKFDEIDFGDIVLGTMYRYFKSLTFDEEAESVARRMLATSLSNYFCVKQRCATHEYDLVTFSHGIYLTWQPVVEFCQRNNVDYVCYDRAKTKDRVNFNVNQPSPNWSFDSAWERYTDRELTPEETAQVHQYLNDRILQKGDCYAYNFSDRASSVDEEKQRLGIPLDRKCVSMFTNLIWDAANVSRGVAFPSAIDCVIATIERYRNREDIQILVRSHPAEKVMGTKERYAGLVRDHFGYKLPKNVTLISPEDNVNSFSVIDMSDVGVVNTSTVGLEMAMLGKPVILISETHYRGKGFTTDAVSTEHYFEELEAALQNPKVEDLKQKLAEKYFFIMMFLYQHHISTQYKDGIFQGYTCGHFSKLPASDPLAKIVRTLATGIPDDFIDWPRLKQ